MTLLFTHLPWRLTLSGSWYSISRKVAPPGRSDPKSKGLLPDTRFVGSPSPVNRSANLRLRVADCCHSFWSPGNLQKQPQAKWSHLEGPHEPPGAVLLCHGFLEPCCFSMLSLSLVKLLTCGVIRSYNFWTSAGLPAQGIHMHVHVHIHIALE